MMRRFSAPSEAISDNVDEQKEEIASVSMENKEAQENETISTEKQAERRRAATTQIERNRAATINVQIERSRAATQVERSRAGTTINNLPPKKKGMLDKLASGVVKNWKTRYFHLEEGIMTYFEPHQWYLKGEYDLRGLEFVSIPTDPPEYIRLRGPNNIEICLRCSDANNQQRWKAAITANIEYANTKVNTKETKPAAPSLVDAHDIVEQIPVNKDTITMPDGCCGWLSKKGQLFPSIKRRYFVLEAGILSYYKENVTELMESPSEKTLASDSGSGKSTPRQRRRSTRRIPKPLGKFSIYDYSFSHEIKSGRIQLQLEPGRRSKSTRQLTIYFEDYQDRDRWVEALNLHSIYNSI